MYVQGGLAVTVISIVAMLIILYQVFFFKISNKYKHNTLNQPSFLQSNQQAHIQS
jgi:hypothetical protein